MIRMEYLLIVATLSLLFTGCSTPKYTALDRAPSTIYSMAQKNMQDGNFRVAIKQLESLNSSHLCGLNSQRVQLDLIYTYYNSKDLPLARASIDQFMRLNPTHPSIDYVIYMRGLSDMAIEESASHSIFGFRIDRSDRDPDHARSAFRDFKKLIEDFPKSQYISDANKRLIYLKERLSKYELSVARYYAKRGAYVAVINRVEQMLYEYPDTKATRCALILMGHAYNQLKLHDESKKVLKIIASNP